jgi:hypothetical protein
MPEVWEIEDETEEELEDTETAVRMRLRRVGREADFIEHLVCDLKDGRVNPWELPALLENLGARLARLAHPASCVPIRERREEQDWRSK